MDDISKDAVKLYRPAVHTDGAACMVDCKIGFWVSKPDYDALAAKLAEVEAERDDLKTVLAARDHATASARLVSRALHRVSKAEARAEAAEAALPAVYRLALADAEFACTNVIKNYDVTYDGGKKFAPMKTQNAAKGMVSIAREDILALPTPTAAKLMARIQTGEKE